MSKKAIAFSSMDANLRNAERLQVALTRLTELDQQAGREGLHGRVCVEIIYRDGQATVVREVKEATHK